MRIVSFLPAATEICFALGLEDALVGVSPECDFPPTALQRPALSRALLDDTGRSSAETSRLVADRVAAGLSLYSIDEAALRDAAPDLILTQGLCAVCAPAVGDVRDIADRLPSRPEILSLDPHRLEDVLQDVLRIGRACDVEEAALTLVAELRERIVRVSTRSARASGRPRTLCLEWLDPLFAAGHWVPDMVRVAGGEDVLGRPGEKAFRIDGRAIALAAPEVAVLMPCGYHADRVAKEASAVTSRSFWRDLPAARRDRVWVVDASSYFNRPGPRVVDGIEILAHILHPDAFPRGWPPHAAHPWTG